MAIGAALGSTALFISAGQSPAAAASNTPPVAVDDTYNTVRNVPITVPAPGVLGNDTDIDADTLTVVSAAPARDSGNTIAINPNGSFTFTPAPGVVGITYFTYTISDGRGGTDSGFDTVFIDPDPRECNGQLPTILGTAGNDTLVGTPGPDIISGLGGNDTIGGGDGNDTINGGDGNDTIFGDAGNDTILGGAGDDTIQGGAGEDAIDGGKGNDFISGGDGNDRLNGDKGDDFIIGDAGDDTVDGGQGNDFILGDVGNDLLFGGLGDDYISGDDGFDTCDPVNVHRAVGTDQYSACEAGRGATPL